MNTGQVLGANDRHGGEAGRRPIHFQDAYATVSSALGIDVRQATYHDLNGRPQYLIDNDWHGVGREPV